MGIRMVVRIGIVPVIIEDVNILGNVLCRIETTKQNEYFV